LHSYVTRIVICNSVPEQFEDAAVKSRMEFQYINKPVFDTARSVKFRGTHLKFGESMSTVKEDDDDQYSEVSISYTDIVYYL
jgi:hypothetical protein